MPRRQPKPEKQIQEKIKETLDLIMSEESLDIESITTADLPKLKNSEILDFTEAKQTTYNDAKSLLDNMVDFYLDKNLIDESDHIKYKKSIDSMNLSSMLLQLKTAQHAIIKLLEEIDMGNAQPRIFEVLAQLQSQIMQMPKDYQNYVEKMEDSYKRLKSDMDQKVYNGSMVIDGESTQSTNLSGIKVRGTKGLMENLRDIMGSEIEDVTVEEIDENSIVNARKKIARDVEGNIEGTDADSEMDIDPELFN